MSTHAGVGQRTFGSVVRVLSTLALCALLGSCGSDDDDGGGAGSAPMVTAGLGAPCTGDECISGSVCSRAGLFRGQCSTQCSGVAACSMLAMGKNTECFNGECGLRCGSNLVV